MKRLPKTWHGTPLARGKATDGDRMDVLRCDVAKSDDEWPSGEFYVVVPDRKDGTDLREGYVFANRRNAVAYARGCSHGNVDHRVLKCTSELFVIATGNEL